MSVDWLAMSFPFAVLLEPDVGKVPAAREGPAFFHPFVSVDSRAHRHIVAVIRTSSARFEPEHTLILGEKKSAGRRKTAPDS